MHCIPENACFSHCPLPLCPINPAAKLSKPIPISFLPTPASCSVSALCFVSAFCPSHLHPFLHSPYLPSPFYLSHPHLSHSYSSRVFFSAAAESLPSQSSESAAQPVSEDATLAEENSTAEELLLAVRGKRTEEAWKLFTSLQKKGVLSCREGLSRLVAQLSHQGSPTSLSRAQLVVAHLQKRDRLELLDRDSVGLLTVATAKAGAARYALGILRIMLVNQLYPSVRVWSAVVSRLGKQLDEVPLALEIFNEICGMLKKEKKLVKSSMKDGHSCEEVSCKTREAERGRSPLDLAEAEEVGSSGSVLEMMPDTGAFNAALNACANSGLVEEAQLLLAEMPLFRVSPDVLTFNILIKLYARAESVCELERVLDRMVEAGVEPDISTFSSLVAAYVGLGDLQKAEKLVHNLQRGMVVQSDITEHEMRRGEKEALDARSRNNSIQTADLVESTSTMELNSSGEGKDLNAYENSNATIESKLEQSWGKWGEKFKPDVRMYTTLMKGYVRQGRLQDAIQLLIAMQHQQDPRSLPNEVTFTTAIKACVTMGLMDEARSILEEMAAQKVPANTVTYNTLLQGYCSASDMDKAHALVEDMKKAGVLLDVVTYNTMINGCIECDDNFGALALFREMRGAGMAPTKVSYTTLMKAFGKSGQTKLVTKVFEEMSLDPRVKVDVIAWNTLIDSYCKAGLMGDAKKFLNMMKEQGVSPTAATYGTIVKGFAKIGKTGEVLVLWNEIREKTQLKGSRIEHFKPDWALTDSLVDTFLRAGYFQKALEVVSCMEEQGIAADKTKYKRMFIELYSDLYTSKHASQRRRDRSAERRRAVEAFKFWVGLPNKYYESDWSP
ncbi:hypothetical protein O6H91_21G007300 [Diphasiastrum complanatum]|uniref:Uncharacterized protein n=2 Tax=Diphasiastrum complanatum TaxID=34168 RepID=A0ACC2AHF3_DIPCM|nr:hypothetical protein O6H91_21G007300 [Diphasiastrum complanatum]KAJ7516980.1 hypothetical protein O6H91_21G007300 [Diphasiastrum complanatum]